MICTRVSFCLRCPAELKMGWGYGSPIVLLAARSVTLLLCPMLDVGLTRPACVQRDGVGAADGAQSLDNLSAVTA